MSNHSMEAAWQRYIDNTPELPRRSRRKREFVAGYLAGWAESEREIIYSQEELDELPRWSIVVDKNEDVAWQKRGQDANEGWYMTANKHKATGLIQFPVTVVWTPSE